MDVYLLENFRTSPGLLKHFFLTQLILSDKADDRDVGIKLGLLLYRFDHNTQMTHLTQDFRALSIL